MNVLESIMTGRMSWVEVIFWFLAVVAAISCIAIICYGLFIAIDSWFLPRKRGVGTVTQKVFVPAHIDQILIFDSETKMNMPYNIPYPDDWSIGVLIEGMQGSISVPETFFSSIEEGAAVTVEYVTGRVSQRSIYLKSVDIVSP